MYDFTGCECAICHQHFKLDNDIVVCPDCGTPYHRDCYDTLGHCKYEHAHSQGFAWTPPEFEHHGNMIRCPRCSTENKKANEYCSRCGLSLHDVENTQDTSTKTKHENAQAADRETIASSYQKSTSAYQQTTSQQNDAYELLKNGLPPFGKPIDQNETFEGVPVAEWVSYIGLASPAYLSSFQQMKQFKRNYSFSFSAMLFGPVYFFYRKAWDVAFLFTMIGILLNIPAFLTILLYSESAYMPAISEATLLTWTQISGVLSWVLMMVRGLYGNYLYKISAAKTIKKIKARAHDTKERFFLLRMYGGTSFGAVVLVFVAMVALASIFSMVIGPDLETMIKFLYQ